MFQQLNIFIRELLGKSDLAYEQLPDDDTCV